MADIIGGVGISHVPSIGAAFDRDLTETADWKAVFDGYRPAREWVARMRPDAAIVVYNDHASAFSLDVVPTFAIGLANGFRPADEGYGRRQVPDFEGAPELGWHLVEHLVAANFDPAICQAMDLDHGFSVPMTSLWGAVKQWPVKVVPIAVNVVQYPTPTARRCLDLGVAIADAVASLESDARVLVVGTGGMSHQLQGQRAGHINPRFDRMFLDKLGGDPHALTELSTTDYIRLAGSEGAELIMWLVMRGALGPVAAEVYRHYHVPASNTAAGVIVLEPVR